MSNSKLIFTRRTSKEIEVFGGIVYIDIDYKNIGELHECDVIVELTAGRHKIKMYKSHTYNTFIGFAEIEVELKENECLVLKYSAPLVVNQPGHIIVSDFVSYQNIEHNLAKDNQKLTEEIAAEEKKRELFERETNKNNWWIYILIFIVPFLLWLIHYIEISSLYF